MITYKTTDFGVRIPVLHDVVLKEYTTRDLLGRYKEIENKYKGMHHWCEQNCQSNFYFYPSWTRKLGAQFKNDEDAVMFALRWS